MHLQPSSHYRSNDVVQTPVALARRLAAHFRPHGRVLEPCCGDGHFLAALRAQVRASGTATAPVAWCEIARGRDFFAWDRRVDWVVTNPPWSQFRAFLQHAMTVSDHVVFLVTVNHLWTRARVRDLKAAGFGLREIVLVDMPRTFPPLGFQLGAAHLARGWTGPVTLTDWTRGA